MARERLASTAAWGVWAVAVLAYVFTMINRTSLGSLGTTAQHHFGVEATVLSTFMFLQIFVYTVAQVPVGVLLDRFGASKVLTTGILIMAAGQILMAIAPNVWIGFLARILVGLGDAGLFISALRIAADWFPLRVLPIITQLTALLGSLGQIVAVVPLAILVKEAGWAPGFIVLALATFLVAVLCFCVLRDTAGQPTLLQQLFNRDRQRLQQEEAMQLEQLWDSPVGQIGPPTAAIPVIGPGGSGIFGALRSLFKRPGLRLGFWVHFGCAGSMHFFVLLWGSAFFTGGEGLPAGQAAFLLSVTVVSAMCGGLVLGPIQARYKRIRLILASGYIVLIAALWAATLLWPNGAAPLGLLFILAIVVGWGGPLSMIGFDIARTHVHRNQIGVATGIVNSGSFTATLFLLFGIGFLLDLQGAGTPDTYTLEAFRLAMSLQYVIWAITLIAFVIEFPKARRELLKRKQQL